MLAMTRIVLVVLGLSSGVLAMDRILGHVLAPPEGKRLLLVTAAGGTVEQVRQALAAGAVVDETGPSGLTPLMCAAADGNAAVVRTLLAGGADPERESESALTPLYFAAINGNEETLRLLLAAGADPLTPTAGGVTALDAAIQYDQPHLVDIMAQAVAGRGEGEGRKARRDEGTEARRE